MLVTAGAPMSSMCCWKTHPNPAWAQSFFLLCSQTLEFPNYHKNSWTAEASEAFHRCLKTHLFSDWLTYWTLCLFCLIPQTSKNPPVFWLIWLITEPCVFSVSLHRLSERPPVFWLTYLLWTCVFSVSLHRHLKTHLFSDDLPTEPCVFFCLVPQIMNTVSSLFCFAGVWEHTCVLIDLLTEPCVFSASLHRRLKDHLFSDWLTYCEPVSFPSRSTDVWKPTCFLMTYLLNPVSFLSHSTDVWNSILFSD